MPATVFRVGVTGHRPSRLLQLEPVLLAQQIETVLAEVAKAARSHTSEVRLVLVTSLAEGADRIAAHVAHRIGYTLQIPLPMPEDLYEEDFARDATPEAGAASVAEFRALLALAEGHTLVLPPPENDLHNEEQRTPCYVAAGEVLLNGCDLLLAITDDGPSGGPGGAKDTEAKAKERGLPTVRVAALPGAPITFGMHAEPLHALCSAVHHVLKSKRVLQHQERLYRCEQWPKRHPAAAYAMLRLVAERRFAIPARPHHETPVPHLRSAGLAKYFRWTDTLAIFYGERSRTAALRLQLLATASIIAALMVIALNASRTVPVCLPSVPEHTAGGHEFLTPTLALALAEVGFLVWLVLGVRTSRRGAWHDRWLRYRSIAEQLRCVDILAPLGLSSIQSTPQNASEHPSATALLPWLVRRIEAELGLGCGVHTNQRRGNHTEAAGYTQDVTAALLSHQGQSRPENAHNARIVCIEKARDLLVGRLFRRGDQTVPGIVDQNIDPPKMLESLLHRLRNASSVGHIQLQRKNCVPEPLLQVCNAVHVARGRCNLVTPFKGCLCPYASETARCSCDEPDLAHVASSAGRVIPGEYLYTV